MIDTYRHDGNFYNMTANEFYHMLLMYKDRYLNLIKDEKVEYAKEEEKTYTAENAACLKIFLWENLRPQAIAEDLVLD